MLSLLIAMSLGFQSTRPMRGGTVPMSLTLLLWAFQSNRPVRGGTFGSRHLPPRPYYFNPPAPCGAGRDTMIARSLTGADFNPPAPCGGGRGPAAPQGGSCVISVHPPREGRDQFAARINSQMIGFQSTRPVRGGTWQLVYRQYRHRISIHPPHAGRDLSSPLRFEPVPYFNPPAPCGAGLTWC